jgi:hypothetical protein
METYYLAGQCFRHIVRRPEGHSFPLDFVSKPAAPHKKMEYPYLGKNIMPLKATQFSYFTFHKHQEH